MVNAQFNSVWDAIADSPAESANLQIRAELMHQILAIIKEKNWDQPAAAKHCGLTQPRLDELLRGQIAKFSIEALINIAAVLGMSAHIKLYPHSTPS